MDSTSCESHARAAKRAYERERKRRYRTEQRHEVDLIRRQVTILQRELSSRLAQGTGMCHPSATLAVAHLPHPTCGNSSSDAPTSSVCSTCGSSHPPNDPHLYTLSAVGPTWLESTLLADPVARRQGVQWLTDRMFHSAAAHHACDEHVDTVAELTVLADDDCVVLGKTTRRQATLLANFHDVGQAMWDMVTETTYSPASRVESMAPEGNGDSVTYKCIRDTELGTNMASLCRRYDLPHRVVLVHLFLRHDERFPMMEAEMRLHDFGWMVAEDIASDVTLVRSRMTQFMPETASRGPISLDQTAAMFGVDTHPSASQVTLARIETNAVRNYKARQDMFTKQLTDQIRVCERSKRT
ncbi:Aste57867_16458 [Aphanomyces stellatus]|uniref:Aste57867_16458 protein n=1 Tax=Aphanomyces stellatus TaxID=120398 RepID=A0A485L5U6_9STRA|nr:hypothetical protein As57867_016401 [Aphanomyces stellatus]VFT93232.1 Aste57867_16458 [Aphanomyces stellatus]